MSRRVSRLLSFTSTQKHSTWNTNCIRSGQYWCGGHSRRYWRSKIERIIGVLQTLFDRYWIGERKTESLQLCHVIFRHSFLQRQFGICIPILLWVGMYLVIWWNSTQKGTYLGSAEKKAHIKLYYNKWHHFNSFAFVLFANWLGLVCKIFTCLFNTLSEMFWQYRTVCRGSTTTRRKKS